MPLAYYKNDGWQPVEVPYSVSGGTDGGRFGLPGVAALSVNNRGMASGDRMHYWPFILRYPISVTGWVVSVASNSNVNNATFRVGIYAADDDNLPDQLAADFGTETLVASTVAQYVNTLSPAVTLNAGVYWLAWASDQTSGITFKTVNTAQEYWFLNNPSANNVMVARYLSANSTVTAGSPLPTTAPAITAGGDITAGWGPMLAIEWDKL